jgi:two-component system, NtrC family, sensor kinase
MSSLRKKIIYAFGLSNAAILAIALTVYADLTLLRDQIVNSEKLRQFLSATQQMQNHEEILLLSQTTESWFQLTEKVEQTRKLFNQYRTFFDEVIGTTQNAKLDELLTRYRNRIDELKSTEATDNPVTAATLHDISQGIWEIVHQISIEHHESLSQKAHLVSWILVITLTAVIIMGVISAVFISRQVVQPISALERQLDAVADGKEKKLTLESDNIEIQSFVQHFNNMLYKQRSQQSQIRHHEKAAALGVLVSGVAHELNNPLSNISTSVQLLMEDDSDAGLRQQWLAHVDSETERARRIVRRLLDSVRQPKLNLQSIRSSDLVNSAVLLIHRQIDPSILLHIEDVADTPVKVDRERMQQVFINLIRNAVAAGASNIWVFAESTTWADSSPEDIERVQGELAAVSSADEVMLFTIADDGPGIPEENLPHLFTPFFTTKKEGEGTGLGLYLVEEIIQEHDGCITVENRLSEGTQFLIWLPVCREETV